MGNHALSAEQLRQLFPIHAGEVFETGKVQRGLQAMRDQYSASGFMDVRPIPITEKLDSAQIMLTFNITEGQQYRMGTLEVVGGKSELAQSCVLLSQRFETVSLLRNVNRTLPVGPFCSPL